MEETKTEETVEELTDEGKIALLMAHYELETANLEVVDEEFKEKLLDVDKLIRLLMGDKELESTEKNFKKTLKGLEKDLDLTGKGKLARIEKLAGFAQSFLKIQDKIFSQKRQRLLKKFIKLGDEIDFEEEVLKIMEERLQPNRIILIDRDEHDSNDERA